MKVKLTCPDCRVTVDIHTHPYPHAPDRVEYCPVCGTQDMSVMPEEDWVQRERERRDAVMKKLGWEKIGGGAWVRSPEWRQRTPKATGEDMCEDFERFLRGKKNA